MTTHDYSSWSAYALAQRLQAREITAEAVVASLLERIEARETLVHAWASLDAPTALAEARELDRGPIRGMLHGIPLGVKDLIDTAAYPTSYGSRAYEGHRPRADAACVSRFRTVGGLVLGKTVTTEFATFTPGPTTNPHNIAHTPGGSSSGSAAAVADGMVPVALGSQTAGSVIRPAAYCGVVGYKPTFDLLPRAGVKMLSASLDTVGVLARTVEDCALIAAGISRRENLMPGRAETTLPRVAMVRTYEWPLASSDVQHAMSRAAATLALAGARVVERDLPPAFAHLAAAQQTIQDYETSISFAGERSAANHLLSERLRNQLAGGDKISAASYDAACTTVRDCRLQLESVFTDVDVLLTPSAAGVAPLGLDSTGDPVFCRMWTALHVPCVHLPFSQGSGNLPVGLQAVSRVGDDARLLGFAAWMLGCLT